MLTIHEEKPRWTIKNCEMTTRRKQQQHMGGPRNRLHLRNMALHFFSLLFFGSLWPLRSILCCNGAVQNDPEVTVTARLDRDVTP